MTIKKKMILPYKITFSFLNPFFALGFNKNPKCENCYPSIESMNAFLPKTTPLKRKFTQSRNLTDFYLTLTHVVLFTT